jgi:hypothetical protein
MKLQKLEYLALYSQGAARFHIYLGSMTIVYHGSGVGLIVEDQRR